MMTYKEFVSSAVFKQIDLQDAKIEDIIADSIKAADLLVEAGILGPKDA
jgi:hypothetical protein